jgi:UDP-N-acetylmuramyl pentapeptide synthase
VIGSLGKTTTARAVAGVTGDHKLDSFRNADYAVIQNLLKYSAKDRFAVLEVGIEKPGQMIPHARMIKPDIVIVTSIASEHVLSFKTLEGIREEKSAMIRALDENGTAILNADDPNVMWMASQTKARIITYGINNEADVKAVNIINDFPHGMGFRALLEEKEYSCSTPFIGRHMLYPALAALALAYAENLDIRSACRALGEVSPAESRMEPVLLDSGAWVIRDDFKSTRESIWAALDTLEECQAKRKFLILGAASEITNDIRYSFHRELGKRIAPIADSVFVINRKGIFKSILQGAEKAGMDKKRIIRIEGNVLSVISFLPQDLGPGDLILVKGRTNQRLSRITLALSGRKVGCLLPYCQDRNHICDLCPCLEAGPGGSETGTSRVKSPGRESR